MELASMLLASTALLASTSLAITNLKGSVLIHADLSSANNSFDCKEPLPQILLGQRASTVVFATSEEPCLFPNTYDQGQRHQGLALRIFQDVLSQIIEVEPN